VASENVELVRSIYAAWDCGDYSSAEWADPEIELVRVDGPDPGSWTGVAGIAAATRSRLTAWEDFRVEAEAYRELDDERVLVLARLRGRGKRSGLELRHMRAQGVTLFHVRGHKVTRIVVYLDRERGLADLCLAPDDSSE
jgi:ketosteroid isomerase-like protein